MTLFFLCVVWKFTLWRIFFENIRKKTTQHVVSTNLIHLKIVFMLVPLFFIFYLLNRSHKVNTQSYKVKWIRKNFFFFILLKDCKICMFWVEVSDVDWICANWFFFFGYFFVFGDAFNQTNKPSVTYSRNVPPHRHEILETIVVLTFIWHTGQKDMISHLRNNCKYKLVQRMATKKKVTHTRSQNPLHRR